MRRIISILLTIMLIFSLSTVVYAEGVESTAPTSVVETENTEDAESDNTNYFPIYMFIIAMCLISVGSATKTKNDKDVGALINEIENGNAIRQQEYGKIQFAINQLGKENPQIIESEAYKKLVEVIETSEEKNKETKARHETMCKIYREANDIQTKENTRVKTTKVSGNKAVPYHNKEEYEKIAKNSHNIPAFEHDKNEILCGFIITNKNNEFIADFLYEKGEIKDVVNLKYNYTKGIHEKFICKTIRELTEYCYATMGGAYFFFNIDNTNEKFITMAKKYGLKKHEKSDKYFIDMNDESGATSIIDAL